MQLLRSLVLLLLLMCIRLECNAQVTMSLLPPPPVGANINNVLNVHVVNPGTGNLKVYLIGRVTDDASGKLLAEFRTNFFLITNGMKSVDYSSIGLVYRNFMDVDFEGSYERTKCFPIGAFNLCATLIQYESEKVLAETCVPTRILSLQPPRLVFPFDSAKIRTLYPVLSWLPVTGPGTSQSAIAYQLTLKEILPGQSAAEAITSNPDFLAADNINHTFYPYPSTALNELTYDHVYVWQVKAFSGDYFIGQSEIWTFKVVKDTLKLKNNHNASIILKREMDGGFYNVTRTLDFKFEADYAPQNLVYTIYDNDMNPVTKDGDRLKQQYGDNRYSIDLKKLRKVHKGEFYLLEVQNEKKIKYYVRFLYKG